jgi:small subunit ribosomal protein S18
MKSSAPSKYVAESNQDERDDSRKRRLPKSIRIEVIDYKDVTTLKYFISERGRILPAHVTGLSAKQQRQMARAVKQARGLALLPYLRRV